MPEDPIPSARRPKRQRSGGITALTALIVVSLVVAGWLYHRSTLAQASQDEDSPTAIISVLHLDSFVVNLSGDSGTGYLRVGIDLGLGIEIKETSGRPPYVGKLRDTILSVLGTRSVDELLTQDGKNKLKADILAAIQQRMPEIHCHEVYFTEFLVQH